MVSSSDTKRTGEVGVWIAFFFLTLAWGSSFMLAKRGLMAYSALQVAGLRLSAAMLALIGLAVVHIRHIPLRKLPYVLASATLAVFAPAFLFATAQTGLDSSLAGVLNALTPCMTFVLGIAFFQQPFGWGKMTGLLLGFAGSAVLILVNARGELSVNHFALYVVVATMCYGLNLNLIKHFLGDVRSLHLSTVTVSMAGLMALPFLLSSDWLQVFQQAPQGRPALFASVFLGLLSTAFAIVVFNWMLSRTSAIFASSITYFIPIVAVCWGVLDGEQFSFWHYAGMAAIIGGIIVLNRFK
jgi:drug/metabolite transporter (DMT)-like permease